MSYNRFFVPVAGLSLLLCAACAPTKPISTSTMQQDVQPPETYNAYYDANGTMNLLALGRAESSNSVDIYDPAAMSFMVLPPERAVAPKEGSIPYNHGILLRDKSVRVYSLVDRDNEPDIATANPKPIADPIPLQAE